MKEVRKLYSLKGIDIDKIVSTRDELKEMVEKFVPKMLQPGSWPNFSGADLVDQRFFMDHFDSEGKGTPIISGVMDLAGWYRAAGQIPPKDIDYIVFLEKDRPWGHTYYCLMESISRIMLITSDGKDFAESEAGLKKAETQVVSFLRNMWGISDAAKIICLTMKTTREILEGTEE